MPCPKNKKKFWIFNYEGPHDWEDTYADKLQWWTITRECKICGSRDKIWPLKDEDMIRRGLVLEGLDRSPYFGHSIVNGQFTPDEYLEGQGPYVSN